MVRPHAVADGQDGVQVVVIHETAYLPLTLHLNDSEFPNSSFRFDLPFLVRTGQMLVDGWHRNVKKISHLALR